MTTLSAVIGADYLEDGVIDYLSWEHPLLFLTPVVATMGAYVAGHLRQRPQRTPYEILQDDFGNPYVPMPPSDTADIRQCVPTEDGTGWQVIAFAGEDCEIEGKGRTLADAIAASEGYKTPLRPTLPPELTLDAATLPDNVIPAFLHRASGAD